MALKAAKFFDNQDLSLEFPTWELGRRYRVKTSGTHLPAVPDIDTNAWHNYTWDMSSTAFWALFLASGRLSEGIAT